MSQREGATPPPHLSCEEGLPNGGQIGSKESIVMHSIVTLKNHATTVSHTTETMNKLIIVS